MIDYNSFGGPPPRRRGRPGQIALAVVAVVGVLAVLVVGRVITIGRPGGTPVTVAGPAGGTPSASPAAASAVTSPAQNLTLGACIDPTTSIVSSFAPAIRNDLARALAGLAPPAGRVPTNTASGQGPVTTPQPGVNLTVRQVDTTSFSSTPGPYTRTVVVPPVPGLAQQRPDPGAQDYLTQLRTWTAGYQAVASARQAAREAATGGAANIAGMPLDTLGWSSISACISGLLTTVPPGGTHSYLLASDLQENIAPQLAGSFNGAPLIIIQACDTGDAAYCQQLLESFTRTMRHLHVGPITVVRPENALTAITQWIRTGQVTP
jgi:hypothetical protein